MSFNMKRFSGALIVTGLVAACGGEELNPVNAQGDIGYVESAISIPTGGGETVECVNGTVALYQAGFECTLASDFSHQYRSGGTVIFTDVQYGTKQFVRSDGFVGSGYLAGNQELYVGAGNGSVNFLGGKLLVIYGTNLQDGVVNQGWLAQPTCLKTSATAWVGCGVERVSFDALSGYLATCAVDTSITCP